jgi:two-component system chemotaxis response regulator CheY
MLDLAGIRPPAGRTVGLGSPGALQVMGLRSRAMALNPTIAVLVVDDSSAMISIIRGLLHHLGFGDVDDARDGRSALARMRNKRYGLVISDWNMEPMTGFDLLKTVRANPEIQTTPFIMVTAESKTENVIAAKKAGVNNYIVKPFNAQTLKSKIEQVFTDKAD